MQWLQRVLQKTILRWGGVPAKKISNNNSKEFIKAI